MDSYAKYYIPADYDNIAFVTNLGCMFVLYQDKIIIPYEDDYYDLYHGKVELKDLYDKYNIRTTAEILETILVKEANEYNVTRHIVK